MSAPTYVRYSGPHVAERQRPAPDSEDAQRLAALADDPESPWSVESVPEPVQEPAGRPPQAAPKDAWVAYAVTRGADQAEAESMTKQQLVDQYGKGGGA